MQASWLFYVALLSLRLSILHCTHLLASFGRSIHGAGKDQQDQNFDANVDALTASIDKNVSEFLPIIIKAAWTPKVNKLRVLCIEVLLIIQTHLWHMVPDQQLSLFEGAWPTLVGHLFQRGYPSVCGVESLSVEPAGLRMPTRASCSPFINQNGLQATFGFEMCFC